MGRFSTTQKVAQMTKHPNIPSTRPPEFQFDAKQFRGSEDVRSNDRTKHSLRCVLLYVQLYQLQLRSVFSGVRHTMVNFVITADRHVTEHGRQRV